MAFKMKGPPYALNNTPIYSTDMEDDVLGMAQSNGTILINKNVSPLELKKNKTIEHEMVHVDQMKRGDLDYTDSHVIWKGKKLLKKRKRKGKWKKKKS